MACNPNTRMFCWANYDRCCKGFFKFLVNIFKFSIKSDSIPQAVWESKWYQADVRLRRDLLFLLMRSQKNFYIRVGPFDVLNYNLLVGVSMLIYKKLVVYLQKNITDKFSKKPKI